MGMYVDLVILHRTGLAAITAVAAGAGGGGRSAAHPYATLPGEPNPRKRRWFGSDRACRWMYTPVAQSDFSSLLSVR
jgi:hypothetical protein